MRELEKILNNNEHVLWEGTPSFKPYVGGTILACLGIGLPLLILTLPFYNHTLLQQDNLEDLIMIAILSLIGIFLAFGVPIYNILSYKHVYYAITDKRIIIQSGLIGRDFKIIDFDQINNARVSVNFLDKLFGGNTGSISIESPSLLAASTHANHNTSILHTLSNIHNPYEVFKYFKKVSYDVKTDIEYPNKLRPSDNPGYETKYKPNDKL